MCFRCSRVDADRSQRISSKLSAFPPRLSSLLQTSSEPTVKRFSLSSPRTNLFCLCFVFSYSSPHRRQQRSRPPRIDCNTNHPSSTNQQLPYQSFDLSLPFSVVTIVPVLFRSHAARSLPTISSLHPRSYLAFATLGW